MDNYIPYFKYECQKPSSRFKLFQNLLNINPNLFHKKRNIFNSDVDNYIDNKNNNNIDELLFQEENQNEINKLKSNFINKSSAIETNAKNYLYYISRNKHKKKINLKQINLSSDNSNTNAYTNISQKSCENRNDEKSNITRLLKRKNNNPLINSEDNSEEDNFYFNKNISFGNDYSKKCLLPNIYNIKGTDITDPNYYDKIANQLLRKKNKEISDYNKNLFENKLHLNKITLKKENQISLPPGHISNPKYYNLGESHLKNNIITNPGNHCISPCVISNNFHKLKSKFI